jgi:hypothetical protein
LDGSIYDPEAIPRSMQEELDIEKLRLERVEIDSVFLDPENPRFLHLQLSGQKALSQEDMIKEIGEEDATITLSKTIAKEGVLNPLVVQSKNGKYLVIDGNRRCVVLKMLQLEKTKPPAGIRYDLVPARILPSTLSPLDIEVLKGVLQEGQKPWGRFNDAAYVRRLRTTYRMEYEDIADRLQLSVREVRQRIEDFGVFERYSKLSGDVHPSRFSYFADAPRDVRNWYNEKEENFKNYSELIRPGTPKNKIRSVTTKGGLRDFAVILKDEDALNELITKDDVTMDDAIAIAQENDIKLGAPFLKRLGTMAENIRSLEPKQIDQFKKEPKLKIELERLRAACDQLLVRIKE